MANPFSTLFLRIPAKRFVFGYAALYALTLALLMRFEHFGLVEPLFVLGTLGIGFTFLAWLVTRRERVTPVEVARPAAEAGAVTLYLLLFAFGFLGWGLSWLKATFPDPRYHMVMVTGAKLLTMVALPLLVLEHFGHSPRRLLRWNFSLRRHGLAFAVMLMLLLAFQAVFGGGLNHLKLLHPSPAALLLGVPLCFLYLCVDTGLTEEFLFRVVVQTRLAALFRSETAGVIAMSLLFGLAHAPGYYLRATDAYVGGHPSVLLAVGYTVVMISVFGFMFGMLWARTRSLGLVVMLHAATDLLPNLTEFMETWSPG